jgi:hypothetical protein
MKIHILFSFTHGPLGGGNQFLKALRGYLTKNGHYAGTIEEAQVILFNSFHCARQVAEAKRQYPNKVFVHRVDGASKIYNNKADARDRIVYALNKFCADATVFQSHWSRGCLFMPGRKPSRLETVIINAPDPEIFNNKGKKPLMASGKLRALAASWSHNWEKGFDVYQWMDEQLNFNHIEMIFAGRTPVAFKNIRCIAPMGSQQLAQQMKDADIFITASRNETCPNVLLEALHCGLPAVAIRSGAHQEILNGAGELFDDIYDIPALIERVRDNYPSYQRQMHLPSMEEVGAQYVKFCESALEAGPGKPLSLLAYASLGWKIRSSHIFEKIYYHALRLVPALRRPRE